MHNLSDSQVQSMSKRAYFEAMGVDWGLASTILQLDNQYRGTLGKQATTHHLVPIASGGKDVSKNRKKVRARLHQIHHMEFGIADPSQQLEQILDFNSPVIERVAKKEIKRILDKGIIIEGVGQ